MAQGCIRRKADRFVRVCNREVLVTRCRMRQLRNEYAVVFFGIEPNRVAKIGDRLWRTSCFVTCPAPPAMRIGALRVQTNRIGVINYGLLEFAGHTVEVPSPEKTPWISDRVLWRGCNLEAHRGAGQHCISRTAAQVRFRALRIGFNGLSCVDDRA